MSIERITELMTIVIDGAVLPNYKSISTINVVDFYARLGYIWRLTGNTGGALKIQIVTPAATVLSRVPMSAINYDGSPTIDLYEGGSAASGGNTKLPVNADRVGTYTAKLLCKTGVTYSDDGLLLETVSANNFKNPSLDLWYLKASTQYILKFSAVCNYTIQWAEI